MSNGVVKPPGQGFDAFTFLARFAPLIFLLLLAFSNVGFLGALSCLEQQTAQTGHWKYMRRVQVI